MGTTVGNHADFLDLCWNNGQSPLRVFLPFDMGALGPDGQLIYKDLGNAQTRRAVVSDWATLIDQYWRHPAIMGWYVYALRVSSSGFCLFAMRLSSRYTHHRH